jgi:SAM-dependent methyltransferase
MTRDDAPMIRSIGPARLYTDGAEDAVLEILESVTDRSDGSDQLFDRMTDWPTTYHLSPSRSNLIRPFAVGPDHRVLEIGAGTGAVTRALGESGAAVTALEGDPHRAKIAARRCADLANVEIVCGDLTEFDETGFDLAVMIGVLEYAGGSGAKDGRTPHDRALGHVADRINDNGALLLSIENQLGLKYLLGYREDHLGEPWAGVAGYPGDPAVRTFPKSTLERMVAGCGLVAQRWFYPFPDYKLPRVIITDECYAPPLGVELVDQLAAQPVRDLAHPPSLFCDDRAAHRVFLEAGLGPEVANSYLVLAARRDAALDRYHDPRRIAWHFSNDRRRCWRRARTLRRDGDRLVLSSIAPTDTPETAEGWLTQKTDMHTDYVVGRTLEQLAVDACRRADLESLTTVLSRWSEHLKASERPAIELPTTPHPFAPVDDETALPAGFLDVSLSNFVDDGEEIVFVDREWRAGDAVSADLVRFRALRYFALDLILSATARPFDPSLTVRELTQVLANLIGLTFDDDIAERWVAAEAELQEIVTGKPRAQTEADQRAQAGRSGVDELAAASLPVAAIRRECTELGSMLEDMRATAAEALTYQQRLEHEIEGLHAQADEARGYMKMIETRRAESEASLARLGAELLEEQERSSELARERDAERERRHELARERDIAAAEATEHRRWRESFEHRLPIRIWRRVQRLFG